MTLLPSPLLIVTDRHQARAPLDDIVSDAVAAGARWVWLRDRDLDHGERRRLAFRLSEIVHRAGGRLSIGADVELAAETKTGAAHMRDIAGVIRARDILGASALIGMSAHNVADAERAKSAGADYVTLSPIHPTASKPDYGPALGLSAMTAAARSLPVIALGGMNAANAAAARHAGAAGIATMGEAMRAHDVRATITSLLAASGSEHSVV